MQLLQQSEATAAQRRLFFHAVDATDGITAETGLTGTGRLSKNGAASAATSGSIVEIDSTNMPGRYYIEFTSGELDTLGIIEFRFKAAACAEVIARGQVVPFDPYDSVRLGLTALPNAAAEAAGGLYTRGSGAGQINQNANGQIDSRTVTMATDVVTAAAIAADAIGSSEFAQAAADKIWASAARTLTSSLDPTAATIADAVWDEARAGHVTAGSFGEGVASVQGNVTGSTASVTAAVTVGAINADVITAASLAADAGSEIAVAVRVEMDANSVDLNTIISGLVAINADTDDIQARLPAALVGGRIDASVGAMAADVLTAAATAADFGVEIAAAVHTRQMTEGYAADGVAPTLEQSLFMVWSALSEFSIAGTTITAKKLDGATTAMTFTLDDAANPTSRTRAT